jgi:cell division transport system ATP-binding protein
LRRHLGIVFQDYKLVQEWTVEKNIELPLVIAGYSKETCAQQVSKLLAHVKLGHKVMKYPRELSGGEQQRVAVARAISHNPLLLIADEPTGNLDEYSAHVVMELFQMVNRLGTSIIIATHRIPTDLEIPYRHFHIEKGTLHEIA